MNRGNRTSLFVFILAAATLFSIPVFSGGERRPWNKKLVAKLKSIKIKKIDFESTNPVAVFKYLRKRSKILAVDGKGVNFVFKRMNTSKTRVTIKMENIPLLVAIKYVCMAADLDYKIEEYAVVIQPKPAKKLKKR
ncbi:MAG: hypothetical protein GXP32_03720 [Kiritimatiellaeota bacterium]|nr:hypothetical protein [Kiritimatiellota bacterium]